MLSPGFWFSNLDPQFLLIAVFISSSISYGYVHAPLQISPSGNTFPLI